MKYFEATHIYKKFPDMTVDLSITAEKGTFTTILGPSGSGKSTALRIIAGLEKNENNTRIYLNGKKISDLPCSQRNCGMVFQNSALFMNLNVQQNIEYGLINRRIKNAERNIMTKTWLEKFGMSGFEKRKCTTLSGGEMQRIALIRTLIVKPDLILLDEPMSALDAPLRKKLASEIHTLQKKENLTIIMVTHDIEEAKNISDNIILIKHGKAAWEGRSTDFSEKLFESC